MPISRRSDKETVIPIIVFVSTLCGLVGMTGMKGILCSTVINKMNKIHILVKINFKGPLQCTPFSVTTTRQGLPKSEDIPKNSTISSSCTGVTQLSNVLSMNFARTATVPNLQANSVLLKKTAPTTYTRSPPVGATLFGSTRYNFGGSTN